MEAAEYAARTNAYLNECIKFGDAKAGTILVFVSAIGAFTGATASAVVEAVRGAGLVLAALGFGVAVLLLVSLMGVLWSATNAIRPRLDRVGPADTAPSCLNSLPDIAVLKPDKYVEQVADLSSAREIVVQYAAHNAILASIAKKKFDAIGAAVSWLYFALSCAYCLGVIYVVALVMASQGG
jgi:hypothetical protein